VKTLLLVVLVACAPSVDGPVERQRAADRADAERLTAQIAALPGVVRAEVMLHRAARDPLSTAPAVASTASFVVIVDDKADREATKASARMLSRAVVADVEPAIVVELGAIRPELAKVGPFTVEQHSRGPLRVALGIAFAVILGLAGWIAWRERARLRG
jgi:hypothetical protein